MIFLLSVALAVSLDSFSSAISKVYLPAHVICPLASYCCFASVFTLGPEKRKEVRFLTKGEVLLTFWIPKVFLYMKAYCILLQFVVCINTVISGAEESSKPR